jgi:O-antigen ligase
MSAPVAARRRPRAEPSSQRRVQRWLEAWWVAACGIALIVASDYEWRVRGYEEALAGEADIAVLLEVLVYGAVGAYVVLTILGPRLRTHDPRVLAMWGFGVTVTLGALYAPTRQLAAVRGVQLLVLCAVAHAVVQRARGMHLHRFAHAYVTLCAGSVLFGLAVPFPRLALEAGRFNWLYLHPVTAGTLLGIATVLACGYLFASTQRDGTAPWPTFVYGGLALVVTGGLVLTVTRTAIAAAAVGCVVVALLVSDRKQKVDLVAFGLISLVLIGMFAGPPLIEYLERGQTEERLLTLNSRTTLWHAAYDLFVERPVLGYGTTAARSVFLEEIGLGGAHNALVEVAVNNGLVGLFWWVMLLLGIPLGLATQRQPGQQRASADVALIAGAYAFLVVNGIGTEGAGSPANTQITWLFLLGAWTALLVRDRRTSVASQEPDRARRTFTKKDAKVRGGPMRRRRPA